jgi:hypothetical protein
MGSSIPMGISLRAVLPPSPALVINRIQPRSGWAAISPADAMRKQSAVWTAICAYEAMPENSLSP